jgi:hypothetical protein
MGRLEGGDHNVCKFVTERAVRSSISVSRPCGGAKISLVHVIWQAARCQGCTKFCHGQVKQRVRRCELSNLRVLLYQVTVTTRFLIKDATGTPSSL